MDMRFDYPSGQDERYERAWRALQAAELPHIATPGSYGWAGHIVADEAAEDVLLWALAKPISAENAQAMAAVDRAMDAEQAEYFWHLAMGVGAVESWVEVVA